MKGRTYKKRAEKFVAGLVCLCMIVTMFASPMSANAAETSPSGSAAAAEQVADSSVKAASDSQSSGDSQEGSQNDAKAANEENAKNQLKPAATEDETGALTMENHTLKWVSGSSQTVIDDKVMTTTPSSNSDVSVKAQLTYSCGGNEGVDTGKAEIRLPRYVYFDRDGNPIGTVQLSIPEAPATGGATSFNYYIDDNGTPDDKSDDEIVITNYKELQPGGFFMKADIVWKFNAVEVANGYSNDNVQASFKTQGNGGGEALEATSDKLTTTVNTKVDAGNAAKTAREKKEVWQSAWGPKPADADDYFYVVWTLKQYVGTTSTTAPYNVTFEDIPGGIDKDGNTSPTDNNKGEVVAWANYSYYNDNKPTANGTGKSTDFKLGSLEDMNKEVVIDKQDRAQINNFTNSYIGREVVMRYPKDTIPAEGETPTLKNSFKVKITSADGEITERAAISSYTYQRVSTGVDYKGDTFSMYKRQRAGYTSTNSKTTATFPAALNLLRAGKTAEADWAIDVKNMSWNRTENGTKTYDTVLRDGMMYVAGERLLPEDYELTKFYPSQYDIFAAAFDENTGAYLETSTDYENRYEPIKVEVKDAAGNWSEYGTITRTGTTSYKWEGKDGTTKSSTYTTTNSTTNIKNAIELPAGTQDIKFTHTGKEYGVEYRMGLVYKLKPSDHLMGLIGDNTTKFNLINVNEAWGEQDGKIYTPGNEFNNTTTPGIKADVEAQDKTEFGGTKIVLHDFAAHDFTAIEGTGNFTKGMSGPYNEVANQRVKIPVSLLWDYYYTYSSLGITLEEAIDMQIINESREADIYDLLPAGVDVDMSSIRVTTYCSTNVDGKKMPACDYTVEMIDNWRGSGRTMMIIHAKAPDGYRNFDKSSSYVDTGFRVFFDMYDSWDNIETNGIGLKNDAAFYSKDGKVPGGTSDTGVGSGDKDLFENLGGGGGDSDLENNVKYSSKSITVDVPRAAQMGFSKRVKGAADTGYKASTTIPATGDYSYQMRFGLQDNAIAKDIVMYDVLETAHDNKAHWTGTFEGIDVSQIKREFPEIDLKIYYSTSNEFGNLQATSGIDYTDLTNTDIWSTDAPEDLSKVTAVAVDISKTKDGQVMQFKGPISLSAVVKMNSPANYEDYIDNPDTAEDETVYAYNQAFIKQGNEIPEGSETTTVSLKKPELKIEKSSTPVSGTTTNPKNVIAGSTIDYTLKVSNNNGADSVTKVKVEDVIPDGLEIDKDSLAYYFGTQVSNKAPADGSKRVSATVEGQKVTFVIDKLDAREIANLVIPVKVKDDTAGGTKFDNKAKITEFNEEPWEDFESNETHHKAAEASVMLPVSKKVTGAVRPSKKDFKFTITGEDGAPMPAGGNTITISDQAIKYFGTIKYNKPGDYKYTVTEENTGDKGYTYDATVHHITVHVAEQANGSLLAKWTDAQAKDTDNGRITFTNNYQPLSVDFAIPVEKFMGGDPIPDNHTEDFEFTLSPGAATNPMPADGKTKMTITGLDSSDTNKDKTKSYDKITFTEAGTYVYQIKETIGNTPGYTYAYDISTHTVTLKVVDNNGQLECRWVDKGDTDTVLFKNDYEPVGDIISLDVSKAVTGNDRVNKFKKSFKFNLSEPEYEGDYNFAGRSEALPMPNATTTTIVDSGTAQLGQIAIKHAGKYTYTISEENSNAAGYTYDTNVCKVIVDAVDNHGVIETTITYQFEDKDGNEVDATGFVNKYKPAETSVDLTVNKTITGDVPAGNDKVFAFKVKPQAGAPMPADGSDTIRITGEGTGTLAGVGTYTEAGTYKYDVEEVAGNDKGYKYSPEKYVVTVDVVDNDGVLEATQTITKSGREVESMDFENKYEPEATFFIPQVSKKITGNARPDDQLQDFTFTLEGIDGAPMPAAGGETVTINDEGASAFGRINFTKAGTYEYKITETPGDAGGYTYSTKEYNLTVTVTDKDGVLMALAKGEAADVAEFTNIYSPTPVSHQVKVEKKVVGNDRPENNKKEFTFIMTALDGAPMPQNTKEDADGNKYIETKVLDEGTALFDEIEYTETGTYKYTVEEKNEYAQGYSYSMVKYDVTVTITDFNGTLKKTVNYTDTDTNKSVIFTDAPNVDYTGPKINGDAGNEGAEDNGDGEEPKLQFENEYRPASTSVTLPVTKTITGNVRPEDGKKDFTFTLIGEDENTPMPKAGGETVTINDEGTADFGKIVYEKAGTYKYEVTETNGGANSYTYSEDVYQVTVEVTDNDGKLENSVKIEKDGEEAEAMSFENQYQLAPITLTLPVEKVISGDKPSKDEEFSFKLRGEDGAPMPDEDTVNITGTGAADFGEITYSDAGTYKYTVYEMDGGADGYTYDKNVYDVVVTVSDEDGTLVTKWTANGIRMDNLKFVNEFKDDKEVPAGDEDKRPEDGPKTGDNMNIGLMLMLMAMSVIGISSVVGMNYRRKND